MIGRRRKNLPAQHPLRTGQDVASPNHTPAHPQNLVQNPTTLAYIKTKTKKTLSNTQHGERGLIKTYQNMLVVAHPHWPSWSYIHIYIISHIFTYIYIHIVGLVAIFNYHKL
jgi:hypothetical protein